MGDDYEVESGGYSKLSQSSALCRYISLPIASNQLAQLVPGLGSDTVGPPAGGGPFVGGARLLGRQRRASKIQMRWRRTTRPTKVGQREGRTTGGHSIGGKGWCTWGKWRH